MPLRLVEPKAVLSITTRADAIKKHNNGNMLIRIVIMAVLIFLTIQIFSKENEEKKEERRVRFSNPLMISSVGSTYTCDTCGA